jgi:hypothetical protein
MPIKSHDEIVTLIRESKVTCVTLDTSELRQHGYRFSERPLSSLEQLKDFKIQILFSEIIVREVKSHLIEEAVDAARDLSKSKAEFAKKWRDNSPVEKFDEEVVRTAASAKFNGIWDEFSNRIAAHLVEASQIRDLGQLLDRYFDALPPFSKGRKKNEFPDAIALLSIESFAAKYDGYALAVSRDSDWEGYCIQSERLILINDINQCLDAFNQSERSFALKLQASLERNRSDEVYNAVLASVTEQVENEGFYAIADSQFTVEAEPDTLKVLDFEHFGEPAIIESDAEKIVIQINSLLHCTFGASFNFSHYDSVDKDEVYMGRGYGVTEDTIDLSLIITLPRSAAGVDFSSIEVQAKWPEPIIDFGEVEPDWDDGDRSD